MSGYSSDALGVQLGLGQALNILNAGNASLYNKLNSGDLVSWASEFVSEDTLKKIISPNSIGLSDKGLMSEYDWYWAYVNQEYFSSLKGTTWEQRKFDAALQQLQQLAVVGLSLYASYTASAGTTYYFNPNSRLDMIEYNLLKNGYIPYQSSMAFSAVANTLVSSGASPLTNGMTVSTSNALDRAEQFLGKGYYESPSNSGIFYSQDGLRQVRMTNSDITGTHAGGPHLSFETGNWTVLSSGRSSFSVSENLQIFIK